MNKKQNEAVSPFSRSVNLLDNDPLEEIFELNLGDFLTEHLISDELVDKISHHSSDKINNLKKQLTELTSIYSVNNTLQLLGFNNREEYIIYNSIAQTIIQMIEADYCQIFLSKEIISGFENSENDLILVGSSQKFKNILSLDLGYTKDDITPINKAFLSKKVLKLNDVKNKEFFFKNNFDEDIDCCISIPMHNNFECIGVLFFANKKNKEFSEEYINLAQIIGKLFAISMNLQKYTVDTNLLIQKENVQIVELQHMRAELTSIIGDLGECQQKFVEDLALAVDKKGNYEYAHSKKVADLSAEMCDYLGLNEKTKDLIYYAGLLQNIGKITIPEELFNKQGPLSFEEWQKIKSHPNIGVNLLMNINFMSEVIPYIHYQKERWDGKGEPEGLKGNSIPLGSRIVGICEAYCAMTSKRSYRDVLSKEEAIKILQDESASKWDPILIDALIHIKN